jgi:hypothetical protein
MARRDKTHEKQKNKQRWIKPKDRPHSYDQSIFKKIGFYEIKPKNPLTAPM